MLFDATEEDSGKPQLSGFSVAIKLVENEWTGKETGGSNLKLILA